MNITLEKYIKILDAGFSLDVLYLLKLIKDNIDITEAILHPRIQAINQMLLRKELISDENIVTVTGENLLAYLDDIESDQLLLKKLKTNDFDRWWLTYPSSNMFTYKNKLFKGTQSKKIKKTECRALFNKYVNEGYSPDDIINATEYHFQVAKDLSYKEGKNNISFIPNSERYLREKCFQPYIELYKNSLKTTEKSANTVDI